MFRTECCASWLPQFGQKNELTLLFSSSPGGKKSSMLARNWIQNAVMNWRCLLVRMLWKLRGTTFIVVLAFPCSSRRSALTTLKVTRAILSVLVRVSTYGSRSTKSCTNCWFQSRNYMVMALSSCTIQPNGWLAIAGSALLTGQLTLLR